MYLTFTITVPMDKRRKRHKRVISIVIRGNGVHGCEVPNKYCLKSNTVVKCSH